MEDKKTQMKIPVKKSDGTTVFLTMEEFKEYKKNAVAPVVPVDPPAPAPILPPTAIAPIPIVPASPISKPKKLEQGKVETIAMPEPLPVVPAAPIAPPIVPLPIIADIHTELATTTPVTDIFFDEAKAKAPEPKIVAPKIAMSPSVLPPEANKHDNSDKQPEWKTSDHASLLESDLAQETKSLPAPAAAPANDNAIAILAKVKEQFPGPISKDIEGRFDSLVLSRIRDVRSVIDFEQYAKKSVADGGLAFEEDQVGLLLAIIAAAQKISAPASVTVKKPETVSAPVSVAPASAALRITPVMSPHISKPSTAPSATPFPIPKEEYSFSPPAKPQNNKALMQDVTPAVRKQTMGPVDEIQYFSITDFRRLSPKVESAREILKGKFQSLQEESYVLFLDARDAWHESPLFHLYQETILNTLQEKKTLKDALAEKTDGLSQAELDAIVEINHYLG